MAKNEPFLTRRMSRFDLGFFKKSDFRCRFVHGLLHKDLDQTHFLKDYLCSFGYDYIIRTYAKEIVL
jgi:hypothetical protein